MVLPVTLSINSVMASLTQTDTRNDVVIYLNSNRSDKWRVRYEILTDVTDQIRTAIDVRLQKSFSLGRIWPDANSEKAALQKAKLMQNIFKLEFGLTSTVINVE